MPRSYAILDVFTQQPLAGNPLAVVRDGSGLDDAAMQRIAAEFNLSETVFLLPPARPGHSAAARIFTPARELPFAGHPTVGTAVLLATDRAAGADFEAVVVLEETVGPVRCGVQLKSGRPGYAEFDVPKKPAPVGVTLDRDLIAAALGILPQQIGFENHVPTAYEAGVPFVFVPVADLDAIAEAAPVMEMWPAAFPAAAPSAFLYCRECALHDSAFHARMFAPRLGIHEDPATGAAVAAFAGAVFRFDAPREGRHALTIEQGYEMGRPSQIALELEVENGALHGVRIGGYAVILAEGELRF
jgi:trans-2,3-dihydro-3-hydroxyanthranilate isomerase